MRRSFLASLVPLAMLAAACGSSSKSTSKSATSSPPAASATTSSSSSTTTAASAPAASAVRLGTSSIPGLGTVLVNGQGRTLYVFAPDKQAKVTCVGGCAAAWPPLKISAGQKPTTSGSVVASLISSDPDPAGGQVVTYAKWPLYLFAGDTSAGSAHGQALNSSGGLWYVITPAGKLITKKASSSGASGGGAY